MGIPNLFDDFPHDFPEELMHTLHADRGIRIERIVSSGQASPEGFWYDQDEHEWVLLLRGSAGLEIEGEDAVRELKPGDYLLLPAHQRHRVAWTDAGMSTVWLAVFFR